MMNISQGRTSSILPSTSPNNAAHASPTSPSDEDWGDFMQGTNCVGQGPCEMLASSLTKRELSISRYENGVVEIKLKRPDITDLVLSGGGAKGVAYSGAVKALEESGSLAKIQNIYGASAGAITAAVIASGMPCAEIDKLLDDINLVAQLDSPNKVLGAIQHVSSFIGKGVGKIPGKTGDIGRLLFDLLPRLQTKAMPLEALIQKLMVESVVSCVKHAINDPGRQVSKESKECLEEIEKKTKRCVTFGELATLSKDIPEIKQLHITGTAMFNGRPQMVVFNASLTPERDVARAALISGSLPVVFQSPSVQGEEFQVEGERTSFQDGGIMLNTPVLDLYEVQIPTSAISYENKLILKFESENQGNKNEKGTFISNLVDRVIHVGHAARDAQEDKGLEAFKEQTVIVPLKTDQGDFTTMLGGTVNFSMSKEHRNLLQEKLRSEVKEHLSSRNSSETYTFNSMGGALLALDDSLFDEAAGELDSDPSCKEVIEFRTDSQKTLTALKRELEAISSDKMLPANETTTRNTPLELTETIYNAIRKLDEFANTPAKTDWLAKKLNHGNDRVYMELLLTVERLDAGTTEQKSVVLTAAIQEMHVRDIMTKSENFIREVIYPSLYRLGQPDSNVKLLSEAISDLREARTPEDYNNTLKRIVEKYVARNSPLSSYVSATTVKDAQDWMIPDR